jgi:ankyrin repeat protein
MGILDLPNELLFEIIHFLEYGWDLTAFGVANRQLHAFVNTYLYQKVLPDCSNAVLEWIVDKGNEDAFAQCLEAGILASVDKPTATKVLRKAIFLGHDQVLGHLIESGITSIHNEQETGRLTLLSRDMETPLSNAVTCGQIAVARVLVAHGIDEFSTERNKKLLSLAATSGELAMMRYLVEEVGLDPNEETRSEDTALCSAAAFGQKEAVELLLEQGANPNLLSVDGDSPLMIAASQGHIDIVHVLLAHGTNVNPTPGDGNLPIYSAMRSEKETKVAMTQVIAEKMDLDLLREGHENRVTLLTIAATLGKDALVQKLVQEGCYPEDGWSEGILYLKLGRQGPLEWAAEAGHDSVVKILLKHGVNGNHREPLERAIQRGHLKVAEVLLEKYLEEFRRTSWFNDILFSAIEHDACFELLLDHGANPTDVEEQEESVLQRVLESGRPSLAQALLSRGFPLKSPLSIEGHSVRFPWLDASRGGLAMVEFLLKNGLDPKTAHYLEMEYSVIEAIRRENVQVASFFLKRGITISHMDILPECIAQAALLKSSDCPTELFLDTLLRSGVDINSRDQLQYTCIWKAIADYHANQLNVLLQRGADPRLRDNNGYSPLRFAATQSPSLIRYATCVQTILEWFDLHWAEISAEESEELYHELYEAEAAAVTNGSRKIARLLQRFRRVHFDRGRLLRPCSAMVLLNHQANVEPRICQGKLAWN